jgi:hypothetical protein
MLQPCSNKPYALRSFMSGMRVDAFSAACFATRYLQIARLSKRKTPLSSSTGTFPHGWSFMKASDLCSFAAKSRTRKVYGMPSSRQVVRIRWVQVLEAEPWMVMAILECWRATYLNRRTVSFKIKLRRPDLLKYPRQ